MNESAINLVEELLINASFEQRSELKQYIKLCRRDTVEKPVIFVGGGTCGRAAGATDTIAAIKQYLDENNFDAELVETGCIGLCSAEPIMDIQLPGRNRISYKNITKEKVTNILDAAINSTIYSKNVLWQFENDFSTQWEGIPFIQEVPFFKNQKRIVLSHCGKTDPLNIDEYLALGGFKSFSNSILNKTPAQIRDNVLKSGLRGRGGGGFPTAKKWNITANTTAEHKYLICNADESDPGAFMDRAIIEGDPFMLLEGIAITAYATGITQAYIYIRSPYILAKKRLQKAINICKEQGLLGDNILNSGFNLSIKIVIGAGAFVCGEETALIASIEGKRGIPRPKPPYPAERGLFNMPTVINNVETLSNIPSIINKGDEWFKEIGTDKSSGTKVFSLTGKVNNIGLIEVPMGTTIREIIYNIAGGIPDNKKFKAVQIGGPSGSCIPEELIDTQIDYESLEEIDAIMGSGGFIVVDENTCMVDLAKFFIGFLKDASCGKCIPCREGTRRMKEILDEITKKPLNGNHHSLSRFKGVMQLEQLGEIIEETSLCGLGKTAPKPVLSALKYFREEFEEHIYERKCRANVCKGLRSYEINIENCTGCTICLSKCPENAIMGTPRSPHFIIEDKCIGCGICYDVCKFNAITIK
ncbi:MAG: NADH-ubiquinone oxidoreductase-F iron-sulfur binding region domain-containing protein [Bacteroidota bacterium]|nr:NADH-ubiquinone oxidoreductase-F iron-sulfur binding region domain-containing protein [Bacteroidota bacterium]